jgi:6-phosphogluconate dehydrogenase
MKIGIIGLGKMGYNIALNLRNHGHEVIAQDQNPEVVAAIDKEPGISGEKTLKAVCQAFKNDRRVIWLMIPAGPPVDEVLEQISDLLNSARYHYRWRQFQLQRFQKTL